jgi:hypothetical protein
LNVIQVSQTIVRAALPLSTAFHPYQSDQRLAASWTTIKHSAAPQLSNKQQQPMGVGGVFFNLDVSGFTQTI